MAFDFGWTHIYHEGDVAFAKAIGIALDAPDDRSVGPHDDEDDDEEPLFMNSVRLHRREF
jgi:hypothetical protein